MNRTPAVLILVGTRPEAIKLAPVAHAFIARGEAIDLSIVSTGQHDELLDSALANLDLEVERNLGIMQEGQDLYDIGVSCMRELRPVMRELRPDVVIVEGDTATVAYGAMAGFFEHAQVAHVEAGLRSHDKWAPFPEEIFRRIADVLSDHYFAPTAGAKRNLLAEGVAEERINVTGNTVIDAVTALARAEASIEDAELGELLDADRRVILVTAHRRESFGAPIRGAFEALRRVAELHSDDLFIYPVHPNPNVRGPASELLSDTPNIKLLNPLNYSDLVQVLARASLVFTDSGGIQEEAPSFGVPVLVMRDVTERPEGVESGAARLVGTSPELILEWGNRLLDDPEAHAKMAQARNPYGDGQAGARIADILLHRLLDIPRQTEDWS